MKRLLQILLYLLVTAPAMAQFDGSSDRAQNITAFGKNCDLYFLSVEDIDWGVSEGGYNPSVASTDIDSARIVVGNHGKSKCNFHITASAGRRNDPFFQRGAYAHQSDMIEYLLASSSRIQHSTYLKDYPYISNRLMVIEGFKIGLEEQSSQQIYMSVEGLQFVRQGSYTDSIVLRLWEGRYKYSRTPRLHDTAIMAVRIPVVSLMNVSIGGIGNGSFYTLDVGEIIAGSSHRMNISVSSNTPYQVGIRSENKGQLKQANNQGFVPYVLSIKGREVNLSAGLSIVAANEVPALQANFPLDILLNPDGISTTGGTYSDLILIEIRSL